MVNAHAVQQNGVGYWQCGQRSQILGFGLYAVQGYRELSTLAVVLKSQFVNF